jgi:hypothetical protein
MKETGQRQDVAFLALVVAVLAVAVALFVGMRAIRRERPKRPAPKPTETAQAAGPIVGKPASGPRDPFKNQAEEAKGAKGAGAAASVGQTLKLVGVVSKQGDQPVAIIRSTKKRYYARVGARVAGYTLTSISANQAVLEKGEQRLVLLLRQPEPVEE